MTKIQFRLVFNRKNKLNAEGKALLQVEAYHEKRKAYFSTHVYLKPSQWNKKKKKIIRHPLAEPLNRMIGSFVGEFECKELDAWRRNIPISLELLKNPSFLKIRDSFLLFVEQEIRNASTKESTKRNQQTTSQVLSTFKPDLTFRDITPKFIYDFERHLREKGLVTNTVAKHMKHLKTFVNLAIDKGYMEAGKYPFQRYRIKTGEYKHTFLLPEELQRLEALKLTGSHKRLQQVLDAYLFCCYTGMRYSDFVNMSEDKITWIKNAPWIVFRTIKTGVEVKLPLKYLFDAKGWAILLEYRNQLKKFFTLPPNATVNKKLKRIARLAGITKNLSFHSARHTNATLLIYKGASITTVQKLLGHRNLATTQIYSEILEQTIVKDLSRIKKDGEVLDQLLEIEHTGRKYESERSGWDFNNGE